MLSQNFFFLSLYSLSFFFSMDDGYYCCQKCQLGCTLQLRDKVKVRIYQYDKSHLLTIGSCSISARDRCPRCQTRLSLCVYLFGAPQAMTATTWLCTPSLSPPDDTMRTDDERVFSLLQRSIRQILCYSICKFYCIPPFSSWYI